MVCESEAGMVNLLVTKLGLFARYKYRLDRTYTCNLGILGYSAVTPYFVLHTDGSLVALPGYCWDGASGPTWDTLSCRRGSMIHDIGYQLMRESVIPQKFKSQIDQRLYWDCVEDGMWKPRAKAWLWAVRNFGSSSCRPRG